MIPAQRCGLQHHHFCSFPLLGKRIPSRKRASSTSRVAVQAASSDQTPLPSIKGTSSSGVGGATSSKEVTSSSRKGIGKDVVCRFYDCYNAGDVDGVMEVMSSKCEYHDMIYGEPFRGTQEIREYFDKVRSIVPGDIQFVVEDITDGDSASVGVRWHVELGGHEFPFSRGVSFYNLDEQGLIVRARDIVESPVKSGSSALWGIAAVAPLVRKLGPNANPSNLKNLPVGAALMWTFYAGYIGYVLLSSWAPGPPALETPPEVLREVFDESINFFFVNWGLNQANISFIPDFAAPPVSEALFNFVAAWGVMFWPLMVSDRRGMDVGYKARWWLATMLLTNIFFIPYLALRLSGPEPEPSRPAPPPPSYSPALGYLGAVVGAVSISWAFLGRPEFGGLPERLQYFQESFQENRVFFAFCLDAALYSVWQAILMPQAEAKYRFVPFAGLAAWLISGCPKKAQ